jgi:hypothetical protein
MLEPVEATRVRPSPRKQNKTWQARIAACVRLGRRTGFTAEADNLTTRCGDSGAINESGKSREPEKVRKGRIPRHASESTK